MSMSTPTADFVRTRLLLRAVTEALFFRGAPVERQRVDWVEREAVATLRMAGPRARTLFLLCLFGVAWLAPLWIGRWPSLLRLPLNLRVAAMARMEDSPLGAPLVLAIKTVLCFLYYEQAGPLREMDVQPGCLRPGPMLPVVTHGADLEVR
jgi:hypothetical protein